jgi:hypothetical protein
MEAEGDLIDPAEFSSDALSGMDEDADLGGEPAPSGGMGGDSPPPMSSSDDFSFDDDMGMGGEGGEGDEDPNEEDTSIATNASHILNQKLFQQFQKKNEKLEETIDEIQQLIPLLPMEVIKQNDETMVKIKQSLERGKKYLTDSFVDNEYGENMMEFQLLEAQNTLLLDKLNANLKKIAKKNN